MTKWWLVSLIQCRMGASNSQLWSKSLSDLGGKCLCWNHPQVLKFNVVGRIQIGYGEGLWGTVARSRISCYFSIFPNIFCVTIRAVSLEIITVYSMLSSDFWIYQFGRIFRDHIDIWNQMSHAYRLLCEPLILSSGKLTNEVSWILTSLGNVAYLSLFLCFCHSPGAVWVDATVRLRMQPFVYATERLLSNESMW